MSASIQQIPPSLAEALGKTHASFHAAIDAVEQSMGGMDALELPPLHMVTPGLYSRRLRMPAGSIIVSKIHRHEHQYVVFSGKAMVFTEAGVSIISAGFSGVTPAGTRRLLFISEDCDWMTFHPTSKTSLEEIEKDLILPRHLLIDDPNQPQL